jgi:hypothetical protein
LTLWALLCGGTALALILVGLQSTRLTVGMGEAAAGLGLLLFGPVALLCYLFRARHVWVRVDRDRGIIVSGVQVIPWDRIDRIERRRPRFRRTTGPARLEPWEFRQLDRLNRWANNEGVLLGFAVGFLALGVVAVFWLVFAAIVPLFVVPVVEVLAPFGDRLRIVAGGRSLVLRDLRGADEFLREMRPRVRIVER